MQGEAALAGKSATCDRIKIDERETIVQVYIGPTRIETF